MKPSDVIKYLIKISLKIITSERIPFQYNFVQNECFIRKKIPVILYS